MYITQLSPGQKLRTQLKASSGLQLPLWLIRGAQDGPTLAVTAGVHGCEYPGIEAVRRLYEAADPQQLCGNLLLLPLANPNGFYQGAKQLVPSCGRNLNRVFPGCSDGDQAAQIAHAIEKHIYPQADFLLDMHSGDINEELTPLIFFPKAGSEEVNQKSCDMAKVMPLPYRLGSTSKNGLYSWAVQKGLPALIIEIGCKGRLAEEDIALALCCIGSAMGFLGICGGYSVNTAQKEAVQSDYIEAESHGFWNPHVRAGESFSRGQILGRLEDIEGRLLQQVTAPYDGIVWYYTQSFGVSKNDPLIALGRLQ